MKMWTRVLGVAGLLLLFVSGIGACFFFFGSVGPELAAPLGRSVLMLVGAAVVMLAGSVILLCSSGRQLSSFLNLVFWPETFPDWPAGAGMHLGISVILAVAAVAFRAFPGVMGILPGLSVFFLAGAMIELLLYRAREREGKKK